MIGSSVAIVALIAGIGIGVADYTVDHYTDPGQAAVDAAGYTMKSAPVNDIELSYVEGPDNGPPLVMLHAQHMDWYSYNLVMPALAESFHVYVIDYPGHGATEVPDDYPMTASQIGGDLGDFIEAEIGEPVFLTGNSSGGLLSTWLAANRPQLVRALVLEDPPLFSSEADRIAGTIADRSFQTAYDAAQSGDDDFLSYFIKSNSAFFDNNIFPGSATVLQMAIDSYRASNPGEPVELGIVSNDTVRQMLRGMDEYDPRFGAAFHDGTWNEGFDHADALSRITAPTLLMQADTETREDGTLNGAMTVEDAQRAASLLQNGELVTVDASHVVHLDDPDLFVRTLEDFFLDGSND